MNKVVREWLDKAEGDYVAMRTLLAASTPLPDGVCFHAQQCVEKLMKAVLIASQTDAPKTHSLRGLSQLVAAVRPGWDWSEVDLKTLTKGAVEFRYPSETATEQEAAAAADICEHIRPPLLALLRP